MTRLCSEVAAMENATFLGALERWLDATIECNNEKTNLPEKLVALSVEKYRQAIECNIEYHVALANIYEIDEDKSPFYYRHRLLAEIYRSILDTAK